MADKVLSYAEWLASTGKSNSNSSRQAYDAYAKANAKPTAQQTIEAGNKTPFSLFTRAGETPAPAEESGPIGGPETAAQMLARQAMGIKAQAPDVSAPKVGGPNKTTGLTSLAEQLQARANYNKAKNASVGAARAAFEVPEEKAPEPKPATPAATKSAPAVTPKAEPIPTVPIPSVADKQAEIIVDNGPGKNAKEKMQWIGKALSGVVGSLGDAFNARAAALQGRGFSPEKTLQKDQQEFISKENAANRAQTAALQANSLMIDKEIANLRAKTDLTIADQNRLAQLEIARRENEARIQAALMGQGIINPALIPKGTPRPDAFQLR